jgi:hypothetical protein
MPETTITMDNVIDFINVNRDRYLEELKRFSPSRASARCPSTRRRQALRRMVRRRDAPHRAAERDADRHAGNPVVYGDWLGAAGRADDPVLRPLRRAAGRSARALGSRRRSRRPIRDGEIYARGSADDKGQVFMHFKASRRT